MINEILQDIYQFLTIISFFPGGAIVTLSTGFIGMCFGFSVYIRSFKYLYYYYIEHGEVLGWPTDSGDNRQIQKVAKMYGLNKNFKPQGYVSGLFYILLMTIIGTIIGVLWPIAIAIGVISIPNFAIKYFAREKRAKVVFEKTLKGKNK